MKNSKTFRFYYFRSHGQILEPVHLTLLLFITHTGKLFFPAVFNFETVPNTIAFRSMIWASKKIHCKQIAIPHPDITGLTVQLCGRSFLNISIYVPYSSGRTEVDEQNLAIRLHHVYQAFERERSQNPEIEIIVAGDFNRWNSHWGGDAIRAHPRQGEGVKLIDFMMDTSLVQLLQCGTQTYHSPSGTSSTIDLVFTSERLARNI